MILDEIVKAKAEELAGRKQKIPLFKMEAISSKRAPSSKKDFASALGGGMQLIAEVKKASPARGLLCPDFDPLRLARTYAAGEEIDQQEWALFGDISHRNKLFTDIDPLWWASVRNPAHG